MRDPDPLVFFLVIIGVVCLYFLPSWVAGHRQHRNFNAIFALNILLGWSGLGWIIAFVWACTDNTYEELDTA
jgi:ABC-type multidrug transport system permease subunit